MSISRGGDYRTDTPISIGDPEKVTSWPFPEPQKTSAWKDDVQANPPKDVPIALVDHEKEKAEKRTALIKSRMSPPGKLVGLPPLLEEARLKWGIPDGAFRCRAMFDRIHIFPIDPFEGGDKMPGSSFLFRSNTAKMRDEQNGHRGILISMGLTAADQCVSHGVELGHIVQTIRNAPHAQECERLEDFSVFYLVMRAGDLTGSETQEEDLRSGKTRIVDEGGEHNYCFQIEGRKKRVALAKDNW